MEILENFVYKSRLDVIHWGMPTTTLEKLFGYSTWTRTSTGDVTRFLKIFGLTFSFGAAGNCIRPAIQFRPDGIPGHVTIRSSYGNELDFYFDRNGFRWNWTYLARRFGKVKEAPFGDFYHYVGFFGNHTDI